jgi:hypothetical protein
MPIITQRFSNFAPPHWLVPTVECLLSTVPPGHIQNVGVVLTNAGAIGTGKTRRVRGRKHARNSCRGFYHHARDGCPAWVEVIVDNAVHDIPPLLRRVSITRELLLGSVLYHEIGHHLDATVGSPARTGEHAADAWSSRLMRQHIRHSHRIFRAFVLLAKPLIRREAKKLAREHHT